MSQSPWFESPEAAELVERLRTLTGGGPLSFRAVSGGYTPARRAVIDRRGAPSVYAKMAVDPMTAAWLRTEHRFYTEVRAPYLPELIGFDDGTLPILLLEDLSGGQWPPPWRPGDVEAVLQTLEQVAGTPPPDGLPRAEELLRGGAGSWLTVAADPAPFLSLGLVTETWLMSALPELIAAEAAAPLDGEALLHLDVRSDNLCLTARGALLVDWNLACVGNPRLDVACWLPSLHAEGGPAPEAVLPDEPGLACWVAGFFAARAGLPLIPTAPRVRDIQRTQLSSALPWAIRALGLAHATEG